MVSFDPKVAVNSHAYAYTPKGTEDILPLDGWSILRPAIADEITDAMFDVVELKGRVRTTGVVAAPSEDLDELGVRVGDTVGFRKNMDYTFKALGEEFFRTRTQDLLYAV